MKEINGNVEFNYRQLGRPSSQGLVETEQRSVSLTCWNVLLYDE